MADIAASVLASWKELFDKPEERQKISLTDPFIGKGIFLLTSLWQNAMMNL